MAESQNAPNMISERLLAEGFNSFWHDALPMLTPSFIALFNDTYVSSLQDESGMPFEEVPLDPNVTDHGLIAELAFYVAKIAHESGQSIEHVLQDEVLRQRAEDLALKSLRAVLKPVSRTSLASDTDWSQVRLLNEAYSSFLSSRPDQAVEFTPQLPGSGFLGRCYADLSVGGTLFEIKTVTRNFSGHDLRQLFIYFALQRATGYRRWERGGLFNPRRGIHAEFSLDYLMFKLSGGLTTGEVLDKIVTFLADRSVVPDSQF